MTLGGFAGTVLVVDLTRGVITKEPLDPALATWPRRTRSYSGRARS